MFRLGRFMGRGGPSGATAFSPLSLLPTALYDLSEANAVWQDTAATSAATTDGQSIARINDLSGNGFHLLQSTAGARPLFKSSGGLKWSQPDGIDDILVSAGAVSSFTTSTLFIAARTKNHGSTNNTRYFQCSSSCMLYQENLTTAQTAIHGGGPVNQRTVASDTDSVFMIRRSGATTTLSRNNDTGTDVTNAGTAISAVLAMHASHSLFAYGLHYIYAVGLFPTAVSVADRNSLFTWFGTRAGLSL